MEGGSRDRGLYCFIRQAWSNIQGPRGIIVFMSCGKRV